ncbi:hypothetical protein CSIRO_1498 [Bradyrhizobiaceae bacterium SG-6C]|nr:hypothetical protein CSIRO_1498 [Bradyrhizobiaceae bacterium SG-6C]
MFLTPPDFSCRRPLPRRNESRASHVDLQSREGGMTNK